jgi:hypothetical protein
VRAGKLSSRSRAPSSADAVDSGVLSPPRPVCRCDEYSSRIADLESRLTLSKRQAQMAIVTSHVCNLVHLHHKHHLKLAKKNLHLKIRVEILIMPILPLF